MKRKQECGEANRSSTDEGLQAAHKAEPYKSTPECRCTLISKNTLLRLANTGETIFTFLYY